MLPDQSVVWLNSGSKLTYPSVFEEKERKVLLSGEGYFEVEADPEHPFCVSTPKVYGWWPMEQNLMSMPMLTNLL